MIKEQELDREATGYNEKDAQGSSGPMKEAKPIPGRPLYGAPMKPCAMAHCPTNEAGVIFLFGSVAVDLGFMVMSLQAAFPDCEAMRRVEGGKCQPVRIEFEQESRNFLKHMHDLKGCDLIVCWEHNWPECPLEVLELRAIVGHEKILPQITQMSADKTNTLKHGGNEGAEGNLREIAKIAEIAKIEKQTVETRRKAGSGGKIAVIARNRRTSHVIGRAHGRGGRRGTTKEKHLPREARRHGEKLKSNSEKSKSKPQHGGHRETSEDARACTVCDARATQTPEMNMDTFMGTRTSFPVALRISL
jgi:hypothetical protein